MRRKPDSRKGEMRPGTRGRDGSGPSGGILLLEIHLKSYLETSAEIAIADHVRDAGNDRRTASAGGIEDLGRNLGDDIDAQGIGVQQVVNLQESRSGRFSDDEALHESSI